jgi:hypothetical protein
LSDLGALFIAIGLGCGLIVLGWGIENCGWYIYMGLRGKYV